MAARLSARARRALRDFGQHEVVRHVLLPFSLQRATLMGLVFFATRLLPSRPGVQPIPRIPLVESWVRWDSIYYLIAAEHGYGPNPWVEVDAFFPAYPWLIRGVSLIMPAPLAAFVVANVCAFGAMWALYLLVGKLEDSVCARRSVWLALLFPSSFFLTAAYAESTFLLATTVCVLCWLQREHTLAATFAMAAALARPIGLVCLSVPFVAAWLLRGAKRKEIPWFVVGVPVGVGLVMFTHHSATGDPFAFLHTHDVQALGGPLYFRSPESWWAILIDEGPGANLMRRLLNWSAIGLVAGATIHLLRRKELELGLLCVATLVTPLVFQATLFDAFGMARYALVAFPVFLVLARWTRGEVAQRAIMAGFAMLQVILAVVFATWRWGE